MCLMKTIIMCQKFSINYESSLFFKVELSHDIWIKKVGETRHTLLVFLGGKCPFKRDDFSYCFFSKVVTKVIYYLRKENQ